jgi:hypothetical protein
MDYVDTGAVFSPCETYRYRLWRTWRPRGRVVAFVGLNPSTADATRDDPTVRRCIGFARAWGYGGLWMLNLFAIRATDPRVMRNAVDPIGPENDAHLLATAAAAAKVVAAWGVHGTHRGRNEEVVTLLRRAGIRISCLDLTKAGHPRHPLYANGSLRPKGNWIARVAPR